jgi:hypothetical protein
MVLNQSLKVCLKLEGIVQDPTLPHPNTQQIPGAVGLTQWSSDHLLPNPLERLVKGRFWFLAIREFFSNHKGFLLKFENHCYKACTLERSVTSILWSILRTRRYSYRGSRSESDEGRGKDLLSRSSHVCQVPETHHCLNPPQNPIRPV